MEIFLIYDIFHSVEEEIGNIFIRSLNKRRVSFYSRIDYNNFWSKNLLREISVHNYSIN